MLDFLRVWTKTQIVGKFEKMLKFFDENSIEKFIYFYYFFYFRKFVTNTRAIRNYTIFLQHFFRFRGGFPSFPLASPCILLQLFM